VTGGDQLDFSFTNNDKKPVNLTYNVYPEITLEAMNSYYFEFRNISKPMYKLSIPINSYSFFYHCNSEFTYKSEADIVGNLDIGKSISSIEE